jgi:hypothetical protein
MTTAYVVPATRATAGWTVAFDDPADVEPLALGTLGADEVMTVGPFDTPHGAIMLYADARPTGRHLEPNLAADHLAKMANQSLRIRGPVLVVGWWNDGPIGLPNDIVLGLRGMTGIYRDHGVAGLEHSAEIVLGEIMEVIDAAFSSGNDEMLATAVRMLRTIDSASAEMVEVMALVSGRFPSYVPTIL